ncbi:MAG: flagellar brake protein [Clostridiales bacterium]|jgi:c-di-GMP-binding flagellar brake protein YcgR|nr:flagellar brake protein [Clostridiales bacterium]
MLKYVMPGNKIVISKWRKRDNTQTLQLDDLDSEYSYVSQVEDILGKEDILAAVPISKGRLAKLPTGIRFQYVIHAKQGMILFAGKITDYFQENNNFFMQVHFLNNGEIMQRREFYRFACYLPFAFASVSDDDDDADQYMSIGSMSRGEIRDLSGGGMKFVSNEELSDNSKVRCALDLGTDLIITVGKVLGHSDAKDRNFKYEYRLIFVGILQTDQERIIKYIFNEQRRQLKIIR